MSLHDSGVRLAFSKIEDVNKIIQNLQKDIDDGKDIRMYPTKLLKATGDLRVHLNENLSDFTFGQLK